MLGCICLNCCCLFEKLGSYPFSRLVVVPATCCLFKIQIEVTLREQQRSNTGTGGAHTRPLSTFMIQTPIKNLNTMLILWNLNKLQRFPAE